MSTPVHEKVTGEFEETVVVDTEKLTMGCGDVATEKEAFAEPAS